LGREVRAAWVKWAEQQPNPKPSWLVPYEELSEADKEADRCIGEWIWRLAAPIADPLHESAPERFAAKGLQSPAREAEEETGIERLTELLREAYPYLPMAVSLAEELAEMFPDIARPQDRTTAPNPCAINEEALARGAAPRYELLKENNSDRDWDEGDDPPPYREWWMIYRYVMVTKERREEVGMYFSEAEAAAALARTTAPDSIERGGDDGNTTDHH
jgi:hypothetical protein